MLWYFQGDFLIIELHGYVVHDDSRNDGDHVILATAFLEETEGQVENIVVFGCDFLDLRVLLWFFGENAEVFDALGHDGTVRDDFRRLWIGDVLVGKQLLAVAKALVDQSGVVLSELRDVMLSHSEPINNPSSSIFKFAEGED